MGKNNKVYCDVDSASQLMRRFYRSTKETMRAMAGYLPKMQNWEFKKLLARHIWIDATHADMLRSRVLDLRYPKVDADDNIDVNGINFFGKLPTIDSDEVFLLAIYEVIKPQIVNSLKTYLDQSDPLDDAPSFMYLERIIFEMEKELTEYSTTLKQKIQGNDAERNRLNILLHACGGIDGPDRKPGDQFDDYFNQADYEIPLVPGRDPSWKEAKTQVPPRLPKNVVEQRIWVAIDHVNEVWASETVAALIWQYKNMPWELYLNAARWCYDEMRHSMMGEQRLNEMGLEIGIDYPMAHDLWLAFREQGLDKLLFLLHGVEQRGPLHKSHLRNELLKIDDRDSAQDCDFDWADESGHIRFGLQWIKQVYPSWSKKKIMEETESVVSEWTNWISEHQQEDKHGYYDFLARIEKKSLELGDHKQELLNLSTTHLKINNG
jgi:uncharacterized ferritin-like protein (DUF455 family)